MRTKIIAALIAGGVLILAGLATAAVSAPSAASAQEETDERTLPYRGAAPCSETFSRTAC